ncbi:GNAT family N-acetyltransferase [Fulvivirga sedimenti]|uniref:GNAT family N-acetyltransferase n=1 Tax=Fulvivirga sedimenti TaxID=2879465 RepID=A0A9X1HXA1_9BACT|nr:GNAT family N-acetyltransferase [Fulvivirga sedimenti]MCA6078149.1 GNAT family N-acetyltransferase [Fulvivirga sedimenti]
MKIREGIKSDLPRALELIQELADFERAPDEVTNTVEAMEQDGFGPEPLFGFYVAEDVQDGIVGLALYYYRYSTWKGKRMYLEDIIVTESHRGKGIGKALFDQVIRQGIATQCSGMVWQVLDWNEPAIQFYREVYGASLDGEWINCSISREQMIKKING